MQLASGTPRMCTASEVLASIEPHADLNSGGFALGWTYLLNYWFLCPTQVCILKLRNPNNSRIWLYTRANFGLMPVSGVSCVSLANNLRDPTFFLAATARGMVIYDFKAGRTLI